MDNSIFIEYTAFTLTVTGDEAVIAEKSGDTKICFRNASKDYSFILYAIADGNMKDELEVHISSMLASLKLVWNIKFKHDIWDMVAEYNVDIFEDEDEDEDEILDELKTYEQVKAILDKAES